MKKTNELFEFKTLIKVIIGVIVFIGLAYFFTDKVVKDDTKSNSQQETTTNNFNKTIMGVMFTLPEETYYVILYDSTKQAATNYDKMQTDYLTSTTVTKLYYVDLNETFNTKYYVENNSNPKAKSLEELKIMDGTLLEFKNNKIISYTEGFQSIYKKLN